MFREKKFRRLRLLLPFVDDDDEEDSSSELLAEPMPMPMLMPVSVLNEAGGDGDAYPSSPSSSEKLVDFAPRLGPREYGGGSASTPSPTPLSRSLYLISSRRRAARISSAVLCPSCAPYVESYAELIAASRDLLLSREGMLLVLALLELLEAEFDRPFLPFRFVLRFVVLEKPVRDGSEPKL